MKPSPKLIIFGNPLLDVTVQIKDDELLQKYQLEVNGQKEVPLDELGKLISDAKARYGKFYGKTFHFIDSTNSGRRRKKKHCTRRL